MIVRPETERDIAVIRRINIDAFRDHPHSRQTEHLIVDALRDASALALSLVAETDAGVVGHVAFSAAVIGEGTSGDWYLLGPIAVDPAHQGRGVGGALVEAGLDSLRARGAAGVALVGDPAFYERFGFRARPGVTCHGVPDEYVLCLPLHAGVEPVGEVHHHAAFGVEPSADATDDGRVRPSS